MWSICAFNHCLCDVVCNRRRCVDWLMRLDELLPSGDMSSFRHHIYNAVVRMQGVSESCGWP